MPFTAQYHGVCAACDGTVRPGQQIRYNDQDEVEHVECPDPTATRAKICPVCYMAMPATGVCEDCS